MRGLFKGAIVLLIFGCNTTTTSPSSPASGNNALSPGSMPEVLAGYELVSRGLVTQDELIKVHELSQALAKALVDPLLRQSIRDAMRASPHAEHKLVFQDFATDARSGEILRNALRRIAGMDSEALDLVLAAIPAMDFYLPWIEHRQTWRATEDVLVGVTLDVDNPSFNVYGVDGRRLVLDAHAPIPSKAILFLHPAERRFPRRDETSGSGDVIQDPGRFRTLAVERHEGRGPLTPAQECDQGTPGCGGSGYAFPLVLESFEYYYEGDAVGEAEIEFNIYHVVDGVVQKDAFLYYGGDDCPQPHDWCTPNTTMWSNTPSLSSTSYISVDPHEEDYYEDEHWGEQFHGYGATFTSASQLGQPYEFGDYLCDDYFHDDDHPYLYSPTWGWHYGGNCHHGLVQTYFTPIMRYTMAIDG